MRQSDPNMTVIHVQDLVKNYEFYRKEKGLLGTLKSLVYKKKEYAPAVQGVSFDIEKGEIVGFLGPNGAGKTTTLKMLSGILYPTSGSIDVLGFLPQKREAAFKKQFGIVMGQKNQLVQVLPAMDSFMLFKEFSEVPDSEFNETLEELVELLDIRSILDVPVRKLSLGQRMKCELVAALLHSPDVLFLDEPTIGLDVVAQKNIREFIKKYNAKRKTTILLTSHYMDDILELCKRVIIINFGRIIYDGELSTLINTYAKEKIIRVTTTGVVAKEVLQEFGEVEEYQDVKASIRVPRGQVKVVAAKLFSSDLPIDDVSIDEMPIDDIIRAIFENK